MRHARPNTGICVFFYVKMKDLANNPIFKVVAERPVRAAASYFVATTVPWIPGESPSDHIDLNQLKSGGFSKLRIVTGAAEEIFTIGPELTGMTIEHDRGVHSFLNPTGRVGISMDSLHLIERLR